MYIIFDHEEGEAIEKDTIEEVIDFIENVANEGTYSDEDVQEQFSVYKGEILNIDCQLKVSIKK